MVVSTHLLSTLHTFLPYDDGSLRFPYRNQAQDPFRITRSPWTHQLPGDLRE